MCTKRQDRHTEVAEGGSGGEKGEETKQKKQRKESGGEMERRRSGKDENRTTSALTTGKYVKLITINCSKICMKRVKTHTLNS